MSRSAATRPDASDSSARQPSSPGTLAVMELLFVTVLGMALSVGMRYVAPGRQTHGLLLVPFVGAAATAAIWAVCVWIGLPFDGGWIWVIALVGGPLVALGLALALPKRRAAADAGLLERLIKPSAPAAKV